LQHRWQLCRTLASADVMAITKWSICNDMSVAIGRRGFNEQIIGANEQVFGQGGLSRLPRLPAWTRASLPTRQQDREASTEGDDRTQAVARGSEAVVDEVGMRAVPG